MELIHSPASVQRIIDGLCCLTGDSLHDDRISRARANHLTVNVPIQIQLAASPLSGAVNLATPDSQCESTTTCGDTTAVRLFTRSKGVNLPRNMAGMWMVALDVEPSTKSFPSVEGSIPIQARDIHLHTHRPVLRICRAKCSSQWKGIASIGTPLCRPQCLVVAHPVPNECHENIAMRQRL